MKALILLTLLITANIVVKAQKLIAVQNGGAPKFYTDLSAAVIGAAAGDTLCIPGESYNPITINKRLYLVGTGHNPDSTKATSRTMITGITLTSGADNGAITGIYTFGMTIDAKVSGFTISRCFIGNLSARDLRLTRDFIVTENLLGSFALWGSNHTINNNIFKSALMADSSAVKNNLFLFNSGDGTGPWVLNTTNSIIESNIFELNPHNFSFQNPNNVFYHNLNVGVNGQSNGQVGTNNFINGNTPLTSVFSNYNADIINTDGIYELNFHLSANSPYKNAGRDGTDIGIYGGAFPWKEGSIPFNPHFQSINIDPKTDSSGNLKVKVVVAAQNN